MPTRLKAHQRPRARVAHASGGRLRLKIAEKRGDADYFERVKGALRPLKGLQGLAVSAVTGSVLLLGEELEIDAVAELGRDLELFDLLDVPGAAAEAPDLLTALNIAGTALDEAIAKATHGRADLRQTVIAGLIGSGLTQIVRSGFAAPAWHSSFWYALMLTRLTPPGTQPGSSQGTAANGDGGAE